LSRSNTLLRLSLCLVLAIAGACTRQGGKVPPAALADPTGHVSPQASARAAAELASATHAPPPKLPPAAPQVIFHGPRDRKRVALTFDACSTRDVSKYDERITNELIASHTPATIFLGGSWAKQEAAHVRELAANPLFELGNHSYTHPHMTAIADEVRIRRELQRTQAEIHVLTGKTPKYFRPPYGEYDDRVVRIAAELGLTTVEYDLPSGDADDHISKERLIQWVLLKAQPGSIIVMHINHRRFHTAEALPPIIEGLRARGFELVTVGQLLQDSRRPEQAQNISRQTDQKSALGAPSPR
jgi:peptidoglycan/xylan/chitin deacetylase (PgdA/CDA1 family)